MRGYECVEFDEEDGPEGSEMVHSGKRLGIKVVLAGGKLTVVLCSQKTDSTGGASPGPGGPGFVIPGALHVAWPWCRPLLIPGEWAWGPRSSPSRPPLALAHRSVPALPCPWEEVEWTRAVEA